MTALMPAPELPARALRMLCLGVRSMALVGVLLLLWGPVDFLRSDDLGRQLILRLSSGLAPTTPLSVSPLTLWLGAAIAALPVALSIGALWQLWQLFGAFAAGQALTQRAQRHLRRFAWALLARAVLQPLASAALSVVLTMANPVGQRMLFASFSSDNFFLILLGAVLLTIAVVMSDAVRAADENRGFV